MKRWIVRIVICLILGVVTTVAVASSVLVLHEKLHVVAPAPIDQYGVEDKDLALLESREYVPKTTMLIPSTGKAEPIKKLIVAVRTAETRLAEQRAIYEYGETDDLVGGLFTRPLFVERCTGWPLNSVGMRDWNPGTTLKPMTSEVWPIWPGFIINTLFYGVIWFGIFFGFGSAKRAVRKRRGRCPKCAYQLRGQFDAGCSECGWNRPQDDA